MLILPFFCQVLGSFVHDLSNTVGDFEQSVFFSGKKNEHVLAVARQVAEAQRA